MINARNPKFSIYLEPYSLESGQVGKPMYRPILISRHRSAKAARRALIRLIRGTDTQAKEYIRAVNNKPYAIALRYVARETSAPFKAYSATELESI